MSTPRTSTRAQKLAALVSQHGVINAAAIVEAHERTRLEFSDCLAMIMLESGGGNLFGHDPTSSIPNSWKGSNVTRLKYAYYKLRRARYGAQGVGPCQLTSPSLQASADALGGCWKPLYNCIVGFTDLRQLQVIHGEEAGAAAYNGSGPAAVEYGKHFMAWKATWHQRAVEAGLA